MIARTLHRVGPRALGALLTALAASLAGACDKVPLVSPTGSTITLFANAASVPSGSSIEIIGTIRESGGHQVQNGTLVSFTSTIGSLDPREARTHNGEVRVRFIAGSQSGVAVITAFSGGATGDLELPVGGAAATQVVLSPNLVSTPPGQPVDLVAVVLDDSGNRLPNASVTFTATAGSLSFSFVITDSFGEARTRLTTNQNASVTAFVGSVSSSAATINVTDAPRVDLTVQTTNIVANQTVQFQATITPATGLAIRSASIDFGDGSSQDLGTSQGSRSITHVYTRPGTYTVTVTATDSLGQRAAASTAIVVSELPPLQVNVTASPTTPSVQDVVTISVNATGLVGGAAIARVEYSFGDGNLATNNSTSTTHVYGTPGHKVIRATVVATNGQRGTGQVEINVLQ
jgi:PKD repeat protein